MSGVASVTAAAATSGMIVPPTLTSSCAQISSTIAVFNLSNIDNTSRIYSVSTTLGSVTPSFNSSTGVLTVSGSGNFEVTLTQKSTKGELVGTSKINGRAQITFYTVMTPGACSSFEFTPEGCPPPGGCPGSCDGPGCCYAYYPPTYTTYENSPPAGYSRIDLGQGAYWIRL